MTGTARARLRDELTARLVPALRQLGFRGPDRIGGNGLFHEFRRVRGRVVHVLSIQLDKYQRPRFVLHLHVEPAEGLDVATAYKSTIVSGRVSPTRGNANERWFRADRPWWQRVVGLTSTREAEAVAAALATLDEIERWWEAPGRSEHIRVFTLPYPMPDGWERA